MVNYKELLAEKEENNLLSIFIPSHFAFEKEPAWFEM